MTVEHGDSLTQLSEYSLEGRNVQLSLREIGNEVKEIELRWDGKRKVLPVFDFRDLNHHGEAAKLLAQGKTAAFQGGNYGICRGLKHTRVQEVSRSKDPNFIPDAEIFWWLKGEERPRNAKIPLLTRPEDALLISDFSKVHPEYQHFRKIENLVELYKFGPMHVIIPLKRSIRFLDDALKTFPEDSRAKSEERYVPYTTASFFWMEDPHWRHLTMLANRYARHVMFYGISSSNLHGEEPPYIFDDELLPYLVRLVEVRGECGFDFVINDSIYEAVGAFSSHMQIRLPLLEETPELVVVRKGSVGVERLRKAGYKVRELQNPDLAPRKHSWDENLDYKLQLMLQRGRQRYFEQSPKVSIRFF